MQRNPTLLNGRRLIELRECDLRVWMSRVLTRGPLNSYRRLFAASSQMSKHSARQSDDQSPSVAKPSQQLWTSAACPTVDHEARPESEVSSSGRPPLPRSEERRVGKEGRS